VLDGRADRTIDLIALVNLTASAIQTAFSRLPLAPGRHSQPSRPCHLGRRLPLISTWSGGNDA